MLDDMRVNDVELTAAEIGALENADEVAHLFATLRYNVDTRTTIPDIATLGLDSDDLRQQILRLELLAVDPVDEDIRVYLFEVRSVTAKLRNDIARRFRERPENALLVLTADYETLDFVMLQRENIRSKSRGKPLQQVIRPIPLNINRRNPEAVKLRVLKRFTFTEEDSAYQWEKLRSAYMLAEWSEEYFNNRALFSDYYLKQRLTDTRLTPEWDEDVRPAGREAYKHIIKARKNFSRQPEATIRKGLYEPLFTLLGFDFKVVKASDSNADAPDYELYSKGDGSRGELGKPIAVALTYVWNRNLDDVDTTREPEDGTPDEIPGAMVVSVLEKTQVPWVIVTNGKLWRLYSSTASNKATNYYEVDLEEAIAATDQITALKYWWLMFRQQAFTGFLDTLLSESDKYAAQLRERLKDDVFLRIFPQFAKGFITHMRAQGVKAEEIDLDLVFSGTMTFLYRMMFILYAESLDLLPVSEERGYGEYSLYALKRDLAQVGGEAEAESPDKLKKHYTTKSTTIYDRLKLLFGVIDKGSAELNMPTYNGGLFSAENESGLFLERYAIPDQFLMLGLDRLTRDEDDKTKKLVFIDFKSLGVRQLGSIYEGLLEFKLKIAAEPLAVEKDGARSGRELYIPLKKAKKKDAAAAVAKGEPYLENDKQERKATGSYYTPDYIVKYIVQHTVGPVLERKLNECAPRLRQAQADYRAYAKLAEARHKALTPSPSGRGEDSAVFWNSDDMALLVDDCLNLRVLDPAMGSGHFLVEVVDFVSNKLIDFLNGWSENPVWAALDRTREDILADMERQHVTIDADKLTRVALLKRAVLKRCVYGVDLNPMAVELAKVSLWLDAFTLGAPLSFLDHHLKWGNSLIGARVREVQAALEGQQTLFSSNKFAGVMLATDLMQKVSYLSDNTVAQVQASQSAYRNANDHLAPYKRVLDVYTSRWFGNTPTAGRRGASGFDPTIEFLKRDDTQAWLEDPRNPKNRLPADDYMKAGLVAKTALQAAESKRFFHWELEFPEVFFAPSTPGGQDVKLREDGGFDAVVGNPPYIRPHNIPEEPKRYFQQVFSTFTHKSDILVCFLEQTRHVLSGFGFCGMITSDTWMYLDSFQNLRKLLLNEMTVASLIPFDEKDIFADAAVRPVVVIYARGRLQIDRIAVLRVNRSFGFETAAEIEHREFQNTFKNVFDLSLRGTIPALKTKIAAAAKLLGELVEIDFGLKTGDDSKFIHSARLSPLDKPLIRGDDTYRYYIDFKGEYVHYDPVAMRQHRKTARPGDKQRFEAPKILVKDTSSIGFNCTYDDEQYYAKDMLIVRKKESEAAEVELIALCGILNSTMMKWFYETTFPTVHVQSQELASLPIHQIDFTTPADERERAVNTITAEYANGRYQFALQQSVAALAQGQIDVVHDVLAHLAGQMIDLNKRKQVEIKRFLGWLEDKLRIKSPHPPAPSPTGGEGEETETRGGTGNEGEQFKWVVSADLSARMTQVARSFRKEPTRSEALLWEALRNRQLDGRKFRRQQPIGAFVLDFFCAEERLAVEVNGGIHESQREADRIRQELIEETGIRFVRISADTVENDLAAALNLIRAAFLPSPREGVGEGSGVRGTIDSLTGKSILQGYLGDYQKGQPEVAWKDFFYRLHQNRGRFGVALANVEAEIEREYAASLKVLLPLKDQLAKTDALIDKIVYQLYGLTAAEIELIERPQYEQALAEAKADALKDETLTDDEQKIEKIAEGILPAAQRFFERVDPAQVETALDGELPNWRSLPPDAPTFLLTGDYNLRSLPDHMDFSSSVIPYTKAVEVALYRRIFEPFRKAHRDTDCRNEFLQKFMRGEKELTLGNYMIILKSTSEKALRGFASGVIRDVDGLATTLNDEAMRDVRNKAAHDEVISRDEAGQARVWAFEILGMV